MADRSASMAELMPLRVPHGHYDVAILGGGLAGLSLALQLKRQRPESRILLLDKRTEPARLAAFKVGESSVEIGAHYYRDIVGVRDHLEEKQLRKLGLRFFLPAQGNSDITKRVEFCTPAHHTAYTHQIDRGLFENELFNRCFAEGIDAFRGFRVQDVELGDEKHTVTASHEAGDVTVTARWVSDATGRGNFLRRKLDIGTDTAHNINAAWFRLAGGLDWEQEWSDDEEWVDRMPERGQRLYSTTHLIDDGYWLWLIQLATGPISIGICADPRFHPFERINSFDAFLDWMREHEPQLAQSVENRQGDVLDFLRIENFSYASDRLMSGKDRWTLHGEAVGFIDALYSPGSDFIAYTNTFGGQVINADLDGTVDDIEEYADFYNDFFFKLFNATLHLYTDKYQLFGNPQVFVLKAVFDSFNYFATLGSPFLHGRMREREDIERLVAMYQESLIPMVERMQQFFMDWNELERTHYEGVSVLSKQFEPYIRAQESMSLPAEGDQLFERAAELVENVKALSVWMFHKAAKNLPDPPDEDQPINPLAISLNPDRWEEDGLFSDDGITLAQAREKLAGIEEMDLEARGAVVAG
jgi:2-polyprenyl-6-methoxyphenol hydroxylase-like FAD-dependent oxidoreductase